MTPRRRAGGGAVIGERAGHTGGPRLPTGTVTFVFTDIERSTKLLNELGSDAYATALEDHRELLRRAFAGRGGVELGTQGDALFYVFDRASEAVAAAREGQLALSDSGIRVRMGIHTGEPLISAGDYVGLDVHKAARIAAAGHGGQVLTSEQTARLAASDALVDLGAHRLKDLSRPEHIFQLVAPGLESEFPPLRTLDFHPHNLPLQTTPLVGRERPIADLVARLAEPAVRLLTLTGPAGTGKTRLALAVAAELFEAFPDGVFFVNLAPISDPGLVGSAIAQTIGARDESDRPPLHVVRERLREQRVLLLLDNLEHVLDCATDVGELMAEVPGLKVLATSRIPLHLQGEHEFPVAPLGLPSADRSPDPGELARVESVRLFVERARTVRPHFDLSAENARAVAEICRRLDGLPLAIELAAARIRILSPEAMLTRLKSRLKLLTTGPRDVPSRQQTLRGAIDWSHELLSEEEKILFRRLATFSGGADLAAIEAVCCDSAIDLDGLDGVTSLVEKSLLRQVEDAAAETRVTLLETMHEYALEKLVESGEAAAIARRHAAHYLAMVEDAHPHLGGSQELDWLARLERDHDNFRAALKWSIEGGDREIGLRMAGALQRFWMAHGHLREGMRWLLDALAGSGDCSPAARAKALVGAGALARQQGEFARAEAFITEGLEIWRRLGDRAATATGLLNLGAVIAERGDFEAAEPVFEEVMMLLQEPGEERLKGMALTNLGVTAELRGDYGRAAALYEESYELCQRTGDGAGAALAVSNLGHIALETGDPAAAGARFRESMRIARDSGHTYLPVHELGNLALVAAFSGALRRAARLFAAYETQLETIGATRIDTGRERYERAFAAVRDGLTDEEWGNARAEGGRLTLDEAVEYALREEGWEEER